MKYTRLGHTGLKVSRLTLGCMSFGDHRGFNEWSLDEEAAEAFFRQALDLGITFWDTANVYQLGSSEEYVGRAVKKLTRREDVVLATKLRFKMHDGPGGEGLSRRAVMEQIDASLTRLGTDYVDLYQIHRFYDETPIEETMEALHDVVKAGKVRYLGASSWTPGSSPRCRKSPAPTAGHRSCRCRTIQPADARGRTRDVRPPRRPGRRIHPLQPRRQGAAHPAVGRTDSPLRQRPVGKRFDNESDKPIVDAVQQVAEARGLPMVQIALAGVFRNPAVTAPIIGPTKPHHLTDAVAALDVELTDDEARAIEEPYAPLRRSF